MAADLAHAAVAVAELGSARHEGAFVASLGVDNFDVHHAGAEVEVLEVISDDGGQILVIVAISVAIEVGAVLPVLTVVEAMTAQVICYSVRAAGELHHLGASRVVRQDLWWRSAVHRAPPLPSKLVPARYCEAYLDVAIRRCAASRAPGVSKRCTPARKSIAREAGKRGFPSGRLIRNRTCRKAEVTDAHASVSTGKSGRLCG